MILNIVPKAGYYMYTGELTSDSKESRDRNSYAAFGKSNKSLFSWQQAETF
jgi:hypothetical protein